MASSRFAFRNRIETATLLNGTGGGAPPLDQQAGFPMTNAQTVDYRTLWRQASGVGTVDVDFDLTGGASNVSVSLAALLGHRPTTPGGIGIFTADVYTAPHVGGGYGAAVFALKGSISFSGADPNRSAGVLFAGGAVNARWVRFELTVLDVFSLGRFFLGSVECDLLQIAAPGGYQVTPVTPVSEDAPPSGDAAYNWVGDRYRLFQIGVDNYLTATHDLLQTLRYKRQPVVFLQHDGTVTSAVVQSFVDVLKFKPSGVYGPGTLNLRELG